MSWKCFLMASLLVLCCGSFSLMAQSHPVKGLVFHDENQNEILDKGEGGLGGIPVSNGDTVVLTDRKGRFALDVPAGNSVFPILPDRYGMKKKIKNSNFLYGSDKSEEKEHIVKFPLVKQRQKTSFRIGAIGDIQVDNLQELHYANQTIISELAARDDLDFNIFLGDLVNSGSNLEPYLASMLNYLPAASWTVYGNHDRNYAASHQDSVFNSYYGASHYAFNYSGVHFLVLNNVWSDGGRSYKGQFTDEQIRFVTNNLQMVPKNKLVVISQHIPMAYTKNKDKILSLMGKERKVLILSGHTHRAGRHVFSKNITELVAGASCGNWWTGERDYRGIPHALMQDGTPRNYFVIDFERNDFKLHFKGVGLDEKHQMQVWVSEQDTIDKAVNNEMNKEKNTVYANVYGGSDYTKVFMQVNSHEWIEMTKVRETDPFVKRIVSMNRQGVYPSKYSRKSVLRSSASPHLWKGMIPIEKGDSICRINIKASDPYGFEATGHTFIIANRDKGE